MSAVASFLSPSSRSKLSVVAVLLCCALSFLPASSEAQSAQGGSASGTVQGKAPPKFFGELNRILQGNAESEQGSDSAGASSATSSSNQNGSTIGAPGILPAGATNPSGNNGNPLILPAGGGSGTNNGGSPAILPAGGGASGNNSSSTGVAGTPTTISEQEACSLRCKGTWDGKECKCPATTNPTTGEPECHSGGVFVQDASNITQGGYCQIPGDKGGIGEVILCKQKGYTWDEIKQICVDSKGKQVDIYCDDGDGSVSKAVEDSMTIHSNFATIQPHLDEIFQKGAGCFEGAINVYDISGALPSLDGILTSIGNAIKSYLIQKICDVANKLREKIFEPISKAISFIKNLDEQGEIVIANLTSSILSDMGIDNIRNNIGWSGYPVATSSTSGTVIGAGTNSGSGHSGNGTSAPPNTNAVGEECNAFDRITGRCSTGNVGTGHNSISNDGIAVIGSSNDITWVNYQGDNSHIQNNSNGITIINPVNPATNAPGIKPSGTDGIVVIGQGEVNETTFDALIQQGMQNKQAPKQSTEKKGLLDYLGTLGGLLK